MNSYSFSKEDSTMLKGFAVLCMVYHHLFNSMDRIRLCDAFYIGNNSVDYFLSRLTHPVDMFLILSGIGLYICYLEGIQHNMMRILKLYKCYWLTLVLFLPLSLLLSKDNFDCSPQNLIMNILGIHTNYNYEAWFLLPYVITSVFSGYLFKLLEKHPKTCIIISSALSIIGKVLFLKLGSWAEVVLQILPIVSILKFQFLLILGACLIKYDIAKKINLVCGGVIFIIFAAAIICHYNGIIYALYSLSVIVVVKKLLPLLPKIAKNILSNSGKASTFIWLTHTWIAYHLFKNFIYGFKIPILIYIVLVIISFCLSKILIQVSRYLKIM